MVTGYFILQKSLKDKKILINYTRKIIKVYLLCIMIYLPINIYSGSFKNSTWIMIIKDILINGTFYHLWYFPALILGIWLTYWMIKKGKKKDIFLLVFLLFIIGLFGDSYYGISEKMAFTKNIYNGIFKISNYTRNGLFYAPIFLYLGYTIKEKQKENTNLKLIQLFLISLVLMIIEGLVLKYYHLERHDSMYLMLIPTMYYLFSYLVKNNTENNKKKRNIATTIYIMHPMMIIAIRGVAKILHLESIFIYNNFIHYILIVITTLIFSILWEKVKEKQNCRIVN